MRNIFLALLLANILYFLFGRYADEPPERGVVVIDGAGPAPTLQLAAADPADGATEGGGKRPVGETNDTEERMQLAAAVGRSCVTVGPFKAATDASAALGEFEADGLGAALRSADGQVFIGHWVQIRNVPDRDAGNQMLETLKGGGLGDSYIVETEEEGLKISLGLFGEVARAERIELEAQSLGLPAEVLPRMRDATVFFVDIGLPPGRGAGGIIAKYGEDKVLLRGRATCPGGG